MNILTIIPARGGSKGIKGKNLISIMKAPLLYHTIEDAKNSSLINKIVVSTDDDLIAQVAKESGVEVIMRPDELSNDISSSEDALNHVINTLKQENYIPELIVFLQATSPIRDDSDIDNAIKLLIEEEADSLFSGRLVHGFMWEEDEDKVVPINYNPNSRAMRQNIKKSYIEENGSIYIFKPCILEKYNCRLGGKIVAYKMNPLHSFQIDEPSDIPLMEKIGAICESE